MITGGWRYHEIAEGHSPRMPCRGPHSTSGCLAAIRIRARSCSANISSGAYARSWVQALRRGAQQNRGHALESNAHHLQRHTPRTGLSWPSLPFPIAWPLRRGRTCCARAVQ